MERSKVNIAVGICWQTSLVALPVFIVIRKWNGALTAAAIAAVTAVILKFTWYDHLETREARMGASSTAAGQAPAGA